MSYEDRLRASEWVVKPCPLKDASALVKQYHYAKGCSLTSVYTHGLYKVECGSLHGVVLWLPPTRVACESVNKEHWKKVLSLSRMVVLPGTPKNACSFLLSKSVRIIKKEGRFVSLVTYADSSENHTGNVYRASNWTYVGETKPTPKWLDVDGKQAAQKSTKNRVKSEMEALGYVMVGKFKKHKFVLHLKGRE